MSHGTDRGIGRTISRALIVIRPSSRSDISDRGSLSPAPLHRRGKCLSKSFSPHPHPRDAMVLHNLFPGRTPHDTVSGRLTAQEVQDTNTATVFEHAHRRLVDYRNICQVYYVRAYETQNPEIDVWANDLLKTLWTATAAGDPGWWRLHATPENPLTDLALQNNVRGSNTISRLRHPPSRLSQPSQSWIRF